MPLPWTVHGDGKEIDASTVVGPGERLSWPRTIGIGAQHVVAMFGATFLVPILTGFPPSTTLLFSGLGTLIFLVVTGNRLPSYLGSSFAFIAPITAATAAQGRGGALFGIAVVGILLAVGRHRRPAGRDPMDRPVDAARSGRSHRGPDRS